MLYPYLCPNNHAHDISQGMTDYHPSSISCPTCGEDARRVYTVPYIAVDNIAKMDMTISTGRNFSNRSEFNAYLKERDAHVMDDAEWRPQLEELKKQEELYKEVTGKGLDWGEYNADIQYRNKKEQDDKLKALGVSVTQISKEQFETPEYQEGWQDTVEPSYIGNKLPDRPDGNAAWGMSMPTERVPCPYEDLTNGAVSNN